MPSGEANARGESFLAGIGFRQCAGELEHAAARRLVRDLIIVPKLSSLRPKFTPKLPWENRLEEKNIININMYLMLNEVQ